MGTAEMRTHRPTPPLILASASPRRAELLGRMGYKLDVRAPDIDESTLDQEDPAAYAARVAADKAAAVWEAGEVVVAADTCVVLDGASLGKPTDTMDALRMLRSLAGRSHSVVTAVHVIGPDGSVEAFDATADVRMVPADPEVLAGYVASGEPMDKAGAYGIQGKAAIFIEDIRGSYSAIMGLPLFETAQLLRQAANH